MDLRFIIIIQREICSFCDRTSFYKKLASHFNNPLTADVHYMQVMR